MPTPIALWSGPRNVSTALMYSFAQRDDTRVVDEPLYGHYLRVSGARHPGDDEVMAAMNCDGNAVVDGLMAQADKSPNINFFIKHMAHHLVDLDLRFVNRCRNIFLIRNPREMLPSLTIQLPHATLADTGLKRQWELLEELQRSDKAIIVLDSRELLMNPSAVLRELCAKLNMPFQTEMLNWPTGPRMEDGIWAKYWYHAVHQSTGFAEYRPKENFPDELLALLEECRPWYDKLFAHAIRAPENGE
ncbi:MAG: sulfotransferase family protein [Woeseiaceae bacterium]